MEKDKREKHFVLVHGVCHGAWCWYKVATLLKSGGHKVTVLDLAASGIHPKQVHEVLSYFDYFEPLMEFMTSLPLEERVILVGHSMGGFCISAAMEKFPEKVSVAVFCTAFMPSPDLSSTTLLEQQTRRVDSYMDSDLTLAVMLARPHPLYSDESMLDEAAAVTDEKYGSVHRVYIECDEDRTITEDLQRWMIENNPTDEVKLLSGSDHMPMFSKPKELCISLQEIAEKYP
ncbi:hypothetical protein Q3G72_032911 [Acer saccharum]|nr:hypothetical protein Q3G72_032911 [Acer saccharum]